MPFVKELKLNNFYNYFGDVSYSFKEGMNIIIADNNGGKSKLYNAFLWILSDRVFDSDNRKYTPLKDPENQFKLISDKAKYNAEVGETIATSVTLKFENDNAQRDGGAVNYTITKTIQATKLKKANPFSLNSWRISLGKPDYIKKVGVNTTSIDDPNKQKEISKFLLPESLKTYYMFQGEEITRLVGKELTNAIRKITHINKFDYLENYFQDILNKAKKGLNDKKKSASRQATEAEDSANNLDRLTLIISNLTSQIQEKKEAKDEKDEKYESLREKYTDAAIQYKLIQKIANKKSEIERTAQSLEELEQNYNQNFFSNRWILEGAEQSINKYIALRDLYIENKGKKASDKFVSCLPYNIPDVPSLDKMINDRHCAICDRSLANDSKALNHVINLRDRNKPKETDNKTIRPTRIFLDELFKNSNNVPKEDELKRTKNTIKEKLIKLNREIDDLTTEIRDLEDEQKQKDKDAKKVLDDYDKCKKDLERLISDIATLQSRLEGAERENLKEQKKFNSLEGVNTIEPGYQNKVDILTDLLGAFKETKTKYYSDQAEKLTEIINGHYKKLTKGNQTTPGNVEIEVNDSFNFRSKIKNYDGGVLTGQGSAFQRMKQLALLMGIVQIGKSQNYPLIADAPVSEMSSILTKNFFYCIPDSFRQTIIFVKDLIDDDSGGDGLKLNKLGEEIKDSPYLNARIYINNAHGREQHERETINTIIAE